MIEHSLFDFVALSKIENELESKVVKVLDEGEHNRGTEGRNKKVNLRERHVLLSSLSKTRKLNDSTNSRIEREKRREEEKY